jgi:ubiquitin-activating enzyme E1
LSLADSLKSPEYPGFDFVAFGRDPQALLAFWTLARLLELGREVNIEAFTEVANAVNGEYHWVESIDTALIAEFVRQNAVIAPTAAVFGGIAAQEVLKSLSLKFVPFQGFVATGYLESVPAGEIEYVPVGDRYDPYRLVFGNKQMDVIFGLKYFIVGAGAIGCEILKNWALMGLGTKGKIVVTDMDVIERSNLNRQFLFRNTDIGRLKSGAAAAAVSAMNPQIRLEAHSHRVGEETEAIYTDAFWSGLDGVCNALDNVEARKYNDAQCVYYGKPLLESGTMGPMAHFEPFIPHLTRSYSSGEDAPARGIPQCTLHSFPTNISHCTMWARDIFGGLFTQQPSAANKYLSDKGYVKKMMAADPGALLDNLKVIHDLLVVDKPSNYADCVAWARKKFEELFSFLLRDLVHQYPPDHKDDKGEPFWRGARRLPDPLVYDPANETHAAFITAAARLRADIFGIPVGENAPEIAASVAVPQWQPSDKKIQVSDEDAPKAAPSFKKTDKAEMKRLCGLLSPIRASAGDLKLNAVEFEKDDATNGHIDFIAAAANLRALSYRIKPESSLEIKRIAGSIVPALATTTAMVCGFVCLEVFKVHSTAPKCLDDFRMGQINLASASIGLFGVAELTKSVCPGNGREFTLWDKWVVEGDLTVAEFSARFASQFGMEIDSLLIGSALVYASFFRTPEMEKYSQMKVTEIWVKHAKLSLTEGRDSIRINALFVGPNGDNIVTPPIYLKYR